MGLAHRRLHLNAKLKIEHDINGQSDKVVVEILQGVHQIDGVNANSYLVLEDDGSLTLIDTGMSADGKKILDYIKINLSKQPSDVKTIVLTHSHVDHIRGALAIRKATGGKVSIHELRRGVSCRKEETSFPRRRNGFSFQDFFQYFSALPPLSQTSG